MRNKTSQHLGMALLSIVLWTGATAQAQAVFNLENDFSTVTNSDTSVWSFRYQANGPLDSNNIPDNTLRNGLYSLMTNDPNIEGQTNLNGWANMTPGLLRFGTGDGYAPQMIKNITGADVDNGGGLVWPSNSISFYLDASTLTVLSWLAPRAGTVNVTFEFATEWTNNGATVNWYVDVGDDSGNIASGNIADSDSGRQTVSNVTVTAGGRINFICEPADDATRGYDYTRVLARVSYADAPTVVYDDEQQFDGTNNTETNIWSARYQAYNSDPTLLSPDFTTRNGIYTLLPDNWTHWNINPSFVGWLRLDDYQSIGAEFPNVIQNQNDTNYVWPGIPYFVIPENAVFMSPDANTICVVSWLAPSNGTVSIAYEFNMLDDDLYQGSDLANNGTLFYIDKGDASGNLASGRIDPDTNDLSFLLDTGRRVLNNVSVAAGDRINFVLDPNGRRLHDASADTTQIYAQIAYQVGQPLGIAIANGVTTITWPGAGTLMQAPALNGPWTQAATASPYSPTVTNSPQMFYRLRL